MYIEIKDFKEFTEFLDRHQDRFVSPGYLVNKFGVSRQKVNNWISRDDLIDAYRFDDGKRGKYVLIPYDEVEKIKPRISEKISLS